MRYGKILPWTHNARAVASPEGNKFAWDDAQCGAWSGYRFGSEERAAAAAVRHNTRAAEADRRTHQLLYGPRDKRGI